MDEEPDTSRPAEPGLKQMQGWYGFRQRVGRWLPHWSRRLLYPFVSWRPRTTSTGVSDLKRHDVAPGVHMDVYWAITAVGEGPAASFYVRDDEVLRLDCFGGAGGHLHINMKQLRLIPDKGTPRFFLLPGSRHDQVEQAAFHLLKNLVFCLRTNTDRRVRAFRPAPGQLDDAAAFMRKTMFALLDARD